MRKKNKLLEFIKVFFIYGYFPCLFFSIFYKLMHEREINLKKLLLGSFIAGFVIFMPLLWAFKYFIIDYMKLFKESAFIGKIFLILGMVLVVYGVYQRSQLFK